MESRYSQSFGGDRSPSGRSSSYETATGNRPASRLTPGQELMQSFIPRSSNGSAVSSAPSSPPPSTRPYSTAQVDAHSSELRSTTLSADGATTNSIVSQLKNNLITTSAELMMSKQRVDELNKEKKDLFNQIAEMQVSLNSVQSELRSTRGSTEATGQLQGQMARMQGELRAVMERAASMEGELERERTTASTLRAQLSLSSRETGERDTASHNRMRSLQAALESGEREKDDMAAQLERATRTIAELERHLESSRRESDDARSRAAASARAHETAVNEVGLTAHNMSRAKQELQGMVALHEGTIATLRMKLESASASAAKYESEANAAHAAAEQAQHERDRIGQRWKAAEAQVAQAEAAAMAMKTQLSEVTTALNVERAKAAAAAAEASERSRSPVKARNATLLAEMEAEAAASAGLRRTLRDYDAEKEAVADLLAAFIPLPSFVRDRALEAEAQGASRQAGIVRAGSVGSDGEVSPSGASSATGAGSRGRPLAGVLPGSAGEEPGSILGQLRSLSSERPMLIDALTYMDLQLRQLRSDKERLSAGVEAGRAAEEAYEQTLSNMRRQLTAARSDLSRATDGRDAALDRLSRTDSELAARVAELAATKENLEGAAGRAATASRALDEANRALSLSSDEVEALRSRVEAVRADCESQLDMEKRMHTSALQLTAARQAESDAAHAQAVAALQAKMGSCEAELDASRAEVQAHMSRLVHVQAETERARAEAAGLSHKLVQTEMALSQAEANHGEALAMVRECEASRARATLALEETGQDRDGLLRNMTTMAAEMSAMRSRVGELEVRASAARDAEDRASSLRARLTDTESALEATRGELASASARLAQVKEQARIDYDIAQQGTARVSAELHRALKARESDSDSSSATSAAMARSLAALQAELQGSSGEAAHLRERCRALQLQLTQVAAEAQEQRDCARNWHEEAMRAKADVQSEVDRSASLHRTMLDQLDAVKADFYAFLSLAHPEEAGAALGGAAAGAAGTMRSQVQPQRGLTSTTSLVTTIAADMSDLKRRLEGLVASTAQASSAARLTSASMPAYRINAPAANAVLEQPAPLPFPVPTPTSAPAGGVPVLPSSTTSSLSASGAAYLSRMLAGGENGGSGASDLSASARLYSGMASPMSAPSAGATYRDRRY